MAPNPTQQSVEPSAKPLPGSSEGKTEVTLCIYPGPRYEIRVDGGDAVPVKDLQTAVAGIQAFAQQEAGSADQSEDVAAGGDQGEPPGEEAGEFEAGFNQARGAV